MSKGNPRNLLVLNAPRMLKVLKRTTLKHWEDKAFSYDKAYICALFSQWAYAKITNEDKQFVIAKRFRLSSPSIVFNELLSGQYDLDFEQFLKGQSAAIEGQELRGLELIDTYADQFVIAITLRMRTFAKEIFIIAIRGTQLTSAFDIGADINIAQISPNWGMKNGKQCRFHFGFHYAALNSFDKMRVSIEKKVRRPFDHEDLIYVTGHSLGGAMSSIVHAYWNHLFHASQLRSKTHSAYTFGMPRYGNQDAISELENPQHVLNPWDLIPKLPLQCNDYADSKFEFSSVAHEVPGVKRDQWTNKVGGKWDKVGIFKDRPLTKWVLKNFDKLRLYNNHKIESYFNSIGNLIP